MVRSAARR